MKNNNIKILIGPNGSGKTTYINKRAEEFDDKKEIIRIENESLDSLHKGVKSLFNIKIKDLNKNLKNNNLNDINNNINNKAEEILNDWKLKYKTSEDDVTLKIFKENNIDMKFKHSIKITKNIFLDNWIFEFENQEIEIEKAPSGVKKLLILYLKLLEELYSLKSSNKDNKKMKKLIIFEEIENFLHPSWIKICIFIFKEIFKKFDSYKNVLILISTHNPEVLVLFSEYIEYFVTPIDYGNDIKEINWEDAKNNYEEINKNIKGHEKIETLDDYKKRVKTRLTFELARFLFSKDSPTILCEGVTDQIFIRKHTSTLVVNSYGYFNFGLYISLYFGLYGNRNKFLKIFADGDNKLKDEESNQSKLKKYFENNYSINNVFYFEKDIEHDLYKIKEETKKLTVKEKFNVLEENFDKEIDEFDNTKLFNFLKTEIKK